jgi:hypothetical protein
LRRGLVVDLRIGDGLQSVAGSFHQVRPFGVTGDLTTTRESRRSIARIVVQNRGAIGLLARGSRYLTGSG